MAVVWSNNICKSSFNPCNCYKVASLTNTILGTNQTSYLGDRYVLGDQLGWGQFGIIRACTDKFTSEVLACKSIAKDRLTTEDDVSNITLEIEIMSRLSGHPNVVDLKAVYEEENYVHLVMELCAGGELFHQLEKCGKFSEGEARVIFKQLMQVLMYCHDKGVVHRDLKPENILLATKDCSSPIKLADFGLATYINPGQKLHGTVGSPFYIAPEVLAGGYNQAADVWSAGVILYILLSGRPPFWGKTKSKIFDAVRAAGLHFWPDSWNNISDSAKKLIRGMLCTDPSQRLTARQVLDHSWTIDITSFSEVRGGNEEQIVRGSDACGISSPTSSMTRNVDISFGTGSPIILDSQLTAVTCKSSFSSFLEEPSTPHFESGHFPFHSSCGLDTLKFSTPVYSLPSFAFFSPGTVAEQGNCKMSSSASICQVDSVHTEKLFVLPNSTCSGDEAIYAQKAERTSGSRISSIHSKRNHTIGLGDSEQVNFMATESVIRWASCTNLPTSTSLRFSLVC